MARTKKNNYKTKRNKGRKNDYKTKRNKGRKSNNYKTRKNKGRKRTQSGGAGIAAAAGLFSVTVNPKEFIRCKRVTDDLNQLYIDFFKEFKEDFNNIIFVSEGDIYKRGHISHNANFLWMLESKTSMNKAKVDVETIKRNHQDKNKPINIYCSFLFRSMQYALFLKYFINRDSEIASNIKIASGLDELITDCNINNDLVFKTSQTIKNSPFTAVGRFTTKNAPKVANSVGRFTTKNAPKVANAVVSSPSKIKEAYKKRKFVKEQSRKIGDLQNYSNFPKLIGGNSKNRIGLTDEMKEYKDNRRNMNWQTLYSTNFKYSYVFKEVLNEFGPDPSDIEINNYYKNNNDNFSLLKKNDIHSGNFSTSDSEYEFNEELRYKNSAGALFWNDNFNKEKQTRMFETFKNLINYLDNKTDEISVVILHKNMYNLYADAKKSQIWEMDMTGGRFKVYDVDNDDVENLRKFQSKFNEIFNKIEKGIKEDKKKVEERAFSFLKGLHECI